MMGMTIRMASAKGEGGGKGARDLYSHRRGGAVSILMVYPQLDFCSSCFPFFLVDFYHKSTGLTRQSGGTGDGCDGGRAGSFDLNFVEVGSRYAR